MNVTLFLRVSIEYKLETIEDEQKARFGVLFRINGLHVIKDGKRKFSKLLEELLLNQLYKTIIGNTTK